MWWHKGWCFSEILDSGQSCHISWCGWGTCPISPQETVQVLAAILLQTTQVDQPAALVSLWQCASCKSVIEVCSECCCWRYSTQVDTWASCTGAGLPILCCWCHGSSCIAHISHNLPVSWHLCGIVSEYGSVSPVVCHRWWCSHKCCALEVASALAQVVSGCSGGRFTCWRRRLIYQHIWWWAPWSCSIIIGWWLWSPCHQLFNQTCAILPECSWGWLANSRSCPTTTDIQPTSRCCILLCTSWKPTLADAKLWYLQVQSKEKKGDRECSKDYPIVSYRGFGYMFLFFCPLHGHCYGFHLIDGGEGREDQFAAMFK